MTWGGRSQGIEAESSVFMVTHPWQGVAPDTALPLQLRAHSAVVFEPSLPSRPLMQIAWR
ncbi:MAG: hypothetical protein EBT36_13220 [Betaproteobacteria bacterium]|nr:hypothetical protein [Betaproteobacteria bacterium]HAB47386.1 hypothetical protein [Lautropia sp.]NBP35623.1 hypothetical protein [Betaproteobacteria bacterium]NBQ77555.1 hypothetical protein [Betaproteobacteria bacterium]NBQ93976.1 hypothetical protein [Betaproteobacteria bacterium]